MTDLIVSQDNTPANLPQLELEIKFYLGQTAQNIIEVGKRLIQAKSLVNHGHWQAWLEQNFQFSQQTARKFMECAERFGKTLDVERFKPSQLTEMLALPSAEETEKFIEQKAAEGKVVAEMTIKELREEIASYKKTIEQKDKDHAAELLKKDEALQQSLFDLGKENKKILDEQETTFQAQIDDLQKKLDDAQDKLNNRPTVEPSDYQQTKKDLATAQIELGKAKAEIEHQAADFQEQNKANATKIKNQGEQIKKLKERLDAKDEIAAQKVDNAEKPTLIIGNGINFTPDEPYKLLLTDPPYSTDVDDIDAFAKSWLPNALKYLRRDGSAYVFIGSYPNELRAYLNIDPPDHLKLIQVLVWTYRNTLGQNPKNRYKQNWQACLFYRGVDAPALDCPITNEQWAVQDINAPDGRLGNRYHAWQKPDEIAQRFIRHTTQKGDTVFDPFACTGTFLLAATTLGRKAYGFEINPDNAAIAFDRGCQNGGQL